MDKRLIIHSATKADMSNSDNTTGNQTTSLCSSSKTHHVIKKISNHVQDNFSKQILESNDEGSEYQHRNFRKVQRLQDTYINTSIKHDRHFLEDRKIVKINPNFDTSTSTRIQTRERESPIKKFEDRIERLHRQHKISQLKGSLKQIHIEEVGKGPALSSIHSVVFAKPVKKALIKLDEPIIKRISFGSRRRTCEFKIIHNEGYCLRNSDVFGDKLKSNGGDDDCDTDDHELERAKVKCRMDLFDGYNKIMKKLNSEKRNKTVEVNAKKLMRRTTSYMKSAF